MCREDVTSTRLTTQFTSLPHLVKCLLKIRASYTNLPLLDSTKLISTLSISTLYRSQYFLSMFGVIIFLYSHILCKFISGNNPISMYRNYSRTGLSTSAKERVQARFVRTRKPASAWRRVADWWDRTAGGVHQKIFLLHLCGRRGRVCY